MKGLFYCQSFVAVAPLIRSLQICKRLTSEFDVDFLHGGQEVNLSHDFPRFRYLQLPSLPVWRGEDLVLDFPEDLNAVFLERWESIQSFVRGGYDFFFTELFPFSKFMMKKEIFDLIGILKKENDKCLILCSLRDVMDLFTYRNSQKVINIINDYYDYIFVHSDPNYIRLDETFPHVEKISDKIIYTGFIPNLSESPMTSSRRKEILVSIGSGSFGNRLLRAVAEVAVHFPDYQFIFVLGSRSPQSYREELESFQKRGAYHNIVIMPFLEDFERALKECALSISLAGYSIIDMVCSKTPAIVLPMAYTDQEWRAARFASLGLVTKISAADLSSEKLYKIIKIVLQTPYPKHRVNGEGATQTLYNVQQLLAKVKDKTQDRL